MKYCKKHNVQYNPDLLNFREIKLAGREQKETQSADSGESDTEEPEAMCIDIKVPSTWEEAMDSPQKKEWVTAMKKRNGDTA